MDIVLWILYVRPTSRNKNCILSRSIVTDKYPLMNICINGFLCWHFKSGCTSICLLVSFFKELCMGFDGFIMSSSIASSHSLYLFYCLGGNMCIKFHWLLLCAFLWLPNLHQQSVGWSCFILRLLLYNISIDFSLRTSTGSTFVSIPEASALLWFVFFFQSECVCQTSSAE